MDTIVNNIPEEKAYDKVWKFMRHDTLNTTIKLLENVLDIQKQEFQSKLCRTTDPDHRTSLLNSINNTDKVRNTLRKQFSEFDLPNSYKDNIMNYEEMVKEEYEDYQEASAKVTVMQTTDFAQLVLSMVSLYPCFYRMDEIVRYPLTEFSYDNLNLFTNMRQPCENLIEILQGLFDLVGPYLR